MCINKARYYQTCAVFVEEIDDVEIKVDTIESVKKTRHHNEETNGFRPSY